MYCAARLVGRSGGLPIVLRPYCPYLTADYNRSGLYWNTVNPRCQRVQGCQLAINTIAWRAVQASATNRRMRHCCWIYRPGLGTPRPGRYILEDLCLQMNAVAN